MTFPETPLPLQVDISLDGSTWTDITSDVRAEQQIKITRGRSDWGQQVDYGRCSLTLNNATGTYSPRNPEGPYYGQIGRNTPIRVSVNTGSVALDLPGGAGDYASTPDAAALDITGDLDIRIDATLTNWIQPDYPSAGQSDYQRTELVAKRASGQVSWALYTKAGRPYFEWSPTGGTPEWAWATSDLPITSSGRLALRVTLDVDNGDGGATITFYTADTIDGPWTGLDSGVTTFTTSVYAGTADLKIGDATESTTYEPALGQVHAVQVYDGIDGTLVAAPDFTAQTSGDSSFTDSAGLTWTVTGNAEITNRKVRFAGEVASWTPKWDTGGFDPTVEVEAAGVLRRLGTGAIPTKSPFYREFTTAGRMAAGIFAYWPMEDGAGATKLASAYPSHPAITFTQSVTLADYADWVASDPIPTLTTGSLRVSVPSYTTDSNVITNLGVFVKVPAAGVSSTQRLLSLTMTGTLATLSLYVNTTGNLAVRGYDTDGTQLHDSGFGTDSINGLEKYLLLFIEQSGSDTYYEVTAVDIADSLNVAIPDNDSQSFGFDNTITGYLPGHATAIRFGQDAGMNGTAIGHLTIGTTLTAFSASAGAMVGWNAEEAASRTGRIGHEEGIPSYPTSGDAVPCGPQPRDTALNIMRAAADADSGIFAEQRGILGLRYITRESLYNQPVALTLDYTGTDGLVAPLDPAEDDQTVTNDVSVARTGGSSARVTLDTGPLSTLSPPDGVGLYDTSYTLNLLDDTQPLQVAGWLLHLGTWDELRYPVVTVNLANAPASIEKAAAVDVGSRLQITNPPGWLPPDTIDLQVQGYSETLDQYTWTLAYNCAPAGPWTVAETGIVEDFEDATFAVTITDGGDAAWFRTTDHFNTGAYSIQSGAITNNQTSDAIVNVPSNATELTFWYRTSSEEAGAGFEGDRLLVLVDDTQVLRAQGETDWTSATVDVTGAGTVTFRYAKDNSTAAGDDAAWIDDLTFNRAPMRADTAGSELTADATATATSLTVSTTDGPVWTTAPMDFPLDVRIGGEKVRVTACTSAVKDTFGRTASSSWGAADVGGTWSNAGGSTSDFSVGSGYGSHTQSTVNATRRSVLTAPGADFDLYCDITTSALATGASLLGGPITRSPDGSNFYMARLEFTTSKTVLLSLRKAVAGTETQLATFTTSITHAAGTFVRVRFQGTGSALQARAWLATNTEPSIWHVTATDSGLTAAGNIGVRSFAATGNTNTSPQLRFDNFELVNPQTFTVTRSQNGVSKAQTAGTDVRLADPAYLAL